MRVIIISLLFVACIAFGGCREAAVPNSGGPAPGISSNDISGEYFNLSQFKGKPVLLFFWSSKCCSEQVKQLEPLYRKNKELGLRVVAIEVGASKEAVESFVKANGLTFTNLTDDYKMISRAYRVIGFPTSFLVDKKGIISKKVSGEVSADDLVRLITPLL